MIERPNRSRTEKGKSRLEREIAAILTVRRHGPEPGLPALARNKARVPVPPRPDRRSEHS